jgi:hypothetical protein
LAAPSSDFRVEVLNVVRVEKEGMQAAAERVYDALSGRPPEGSSLEKEFSRFLSHFSIIKSFLPRGQQELSDEVVERMLFWMEHLDFPTMRENFRLGIVRLQTFQVDFKKLPYKKARIGLRLFNQGGEAEVER